MSKLIKAEDVLEALPDEDELNRLVDKYPSYEWEHRKRLLKGYFEGKSLTELIDEKLAAKGIDKSKCSSHSLGGHGHWVKCKVEKAIIRILYLRYLIDHGMSRREANREILSNHIDENGIPNIKQSAIRKITYSPRLEVMFKILCHFFKL